MAEAFAQCDMNVKDRHRQNSGQPRRFVDAALSKPLGWMPRFPRCRRRDALAGLPTPAAAPRAARSDPGHQRRPQGAALRRGQRVGGQPPIPVISLPCPSYPTHGSIWPGFRLIGGPPAH